MKPSYFVEIGWMMKQLFRNVIGVGGKIQTVMLYWLLCVAFQHQKVVCIHGCHFSATMVALAEPSRIHDVRQLSLITDR